MGADEKSKPAVTGGLLNDFKVVNPKRGAKYSPNLFAFLRKLAKTHPLHLAQCCQVYRSSRGGGLVIGNPGDNGWFHGTRMSCVLVEGARAKTFAYQPGHFGKLKRLENFWRDYVRIGRCAIDKKDHRLWNERWLEVGKFRRCTWCHQVTQRLEVTYRRERVEKWVPV